MPDPLTLATVSSPILVEGVKFLYGQAGELLKRRRDRRDAREVERDALTVTVPGEAFARGGVVDLASWDTASDEVVGRLEASTEELGRCLDAPSPDAGLLAAAQALRAVLEDVLGRELTLRGERRSRDGADLSLEIGVAEDEVVGVRARAIRGAVRSRVVIETAKGKVVGHDLGDIG